MSGCGNFSEIILNLTYFVVPKALETRVHLFYNDSTKTDRHLIYNRKAHDMHYSHEEVLKAARVMLTDYQKYDLEVHTRHNILAVDDDDSYRYEILIVKNGKKKEIATLLNREIRETLRSLLKVYGYCRITNPKQSIDKQIRSIKAEYPNAIIIQEPYSGTNIDRPEWEKLLGKIQPGDTIIFDSVLRMGRNANEGVEIYFDLYEKGIHLVFLKEHYLDTAVYAESMKDKDENEIPKDVRDCFRKLSERQIRIAFEQAEKEVQDLQQRTRNGIEAARRKGKQIGQKPGSKLKIKKEDPAKKKIKIYSKDFNGSLSDPECMKLVGVSRNTYYKYKRELRNG